MWERKRQRFEQDGGDTSPALFKTAAKRRLKAKDREMREVSPISNKTEAKGKGKRKQQRFGHDEGDMAAEQRPKTKDREMREVSPLSSKGKGKGQRFGQDRGDLSPALFKMGEWRPKIKYREMGESPALFKMAERRLKAKDREMREVRWRQKRCSKPKQDRKCSSGDTSVDRISMLPDELLGSILSRITLKEQIATSILSRRWRYLWTSTTRLDFDGIDSILSMGEKRWCMDEGRPRNETVLAFEKVKLDFLNLINNVLASRGEGSPIEDFKVHFELVKKDEGYINEWLRYALACKVQRLELNLHTTLMPTRANEDYVLPDTFFSHVDEEVGSNPNRIHFKQLKTISLNRVGVDSKGLEFFLHNCPLLEDLSVSNSLELLSLRVTGPFPSLKRLEICNCYKLKSLEICDVNLVCFKYRGGEIRFLLRNLPMLAHLSVSKLIFEYMKVHVAHFSSILKQLEIFHVNLESSMTSFLLPVEMSNLRQLKVMVESSKLVRDESLLWLADLIQSAPRLEKFVLESGRSSAKYPNRELQRKKIGNLYPHLKEIEFAGFSGVPSDLEFVFHFVDNAAALKKILVDTKKTHEILYLRKLNINFIEKSKIVLDQLGEHLAVEKPGIKLECLFTPI